MPPESRPAPGRQEGQKGASQRLAESRARQCHESRLVQQKEERERALEQTRLMISKVQLDREGLGLGSVRLGMTRGGTLGQVWGQG